MVNSGFGASPPTTSTIEVGLYLSRRISGSLLGPILPAAAMAEANGGGGSDAVVAVAPDPEAADAARSLGALEVHVDALMGAAAAIEDLVASLGAPGGDDLAVRRRSGRVSDLLVTRRGTLAFFDRGWKVLRACESGCRTPGLAMA